MTGEQIWQHRKHMWGEEDEREDTDALTMDSIVERLMQNGLVTNVGTASDRGHLIEKNYTR